MNARQLSTVVILLVLVTFVLGSARANATDPPERFDVDFHLAHVAEQAQAQGQGGEHRAPRMRNLSLLSQLGPADDPAFAFPNADVWAFGNFAYIGTWGFSSLCPATGVKVVDISAPTNPTLKTTIPSHVDTRANDVKVDRINTDSFDGVLLAHSDEPCGPNGVSGFHLFDVTDPTNPVHLSRFETGPVHNLWLYQRGDRAFVLLAVPFAEVFDGLVGLPASDFQIVEVTDPTDPQLIGEWTIGRDAGLAFGSPFFADFIPPLPAGSDCTPPPGTPELCRGEDFPGVLLHDVWASRNGTVAYLSYWDAGLILLDISDPSNPTLIGRGVEPETFGSDEGNAHAAVPARNGNLALVTDEDFTSGPWGFLRVFDTSDPTNPVEIGAFATENALNAPPPDGDFSVHNVVVRGNSAYISWYTDGVRVVDISQPNAPRETASFAVEGPSLFWGVYQDRELIFGSDMFNGLYILKHVP